jgi:hypothetical protein
MPTARDDNPTLSSAQMENLLLADRRITHNIEPEQAQLFRYAAEAKVHHEAPHVVLAGRIGAGRCHGALGSRRALLHEESAVLSVFLFSSQDLNISPYLFLALSTGRTRSFEQINHHSSTHFGKIKTRKKCPSECLAKKRTASLEAAPGIWATAFLFSETA